MTQPIRFAIVGARGYARTLHAYIQRLVDEGRGQLVATTLRNRAAYPDIAARLEAGGTRIWSDYEHMLDECQGQVDVVVLPTPIHLHASMTITALEAGYHVLVEKPVAATTADVERMIAARDASGQVCAVGFQQIYSAVIQGLKRRIVEGQLGPVQRIAIMALWPRNPTYYARNSWAGKLYCDGQPVYDSPFNNALAHQIMNMLYLASAKAQQTAQPARTEADLLRAYDIESFDTGCLRVQTDTGIEVTFAASHACATNVDPVMRLEAEKATVHCQLEVGATIDYADGTAETIVQDDCRKSMFDNLIDVLNGTAVQPLCTLEIARAHIACIEAMHRGSRIVPVPPGFVHEAERGQRVIAGIDQAIEQAFTTGQLFSELRAPFMPAEGR